MKQPKRWIDMIPIVGDMLFSLLTIQAALKYVYDGFNEDLLVLEYGILTTALIFMGIARIFRAFRRRGGSRTDFYRFLTYGLVLLLAALIWESKPGIPFTWAVICLSYGITLVSDRVFSILRNRSRRNIVLNLLFILFLVCEFAQFQEGNAMAIQTMLFAAIHAMMTILSFVFTGIDLEVLKNIVRKTYAMEIILGLLMIILSASYILQYVEPNIPTYNDALWYCFAIVTTIGFGDVSAVSTAGRVISVILGIYGIIVVALITSIIVNFYSETKKDPQRE